MLKKVAVFFAFWSALCNVALSEYVVDDSRLGPVFDGIGGLSGGGVSWDTMIVDTIYIKAACLHVCIYIVYMCTQATSRLLPGYKQEYLDQILDLLFKVRNSKSFNHCASIVHPITPLHR